MCIKLAGHLAVHEDMILPACMHALLLSVLLHSARDTSPWISDLFEWHDNFCYGLNPFGAHDYAF